MTADRDATVPAAQVGTPTAPVTVQGGERYILGEQLGVGGLGVVWAAHDAVLDREVALKLLHDRFLGSDDQARLAAEGRVMAKLSHPNVVAVYDVGERGGRTFVTMELVRGGTLADWVRTPRPWREVVAVFRAAGAGLAAAHAAGIVHRDVKPSNILVGEDGRARMADFGVAFDGPRAVIGTSGGSAPLASTGIAGTPAYLAPERRGGRRADAASDQYAFAVALFEVLHGRRPFVDAGGDELAASIAGGAPEPVRAVPRWLHAVVTRGLAADPAQRFASVADLVAALDGRPRRRRAVVALGVVGVGAAVGAVLLGRAASPDGRCQLGPRALGDAWDGATRAAVVARFERSSLPYAVATGAVVARAFDRYAVAWVAAHDRACGAAGSDELTDGDRGAALACFERRRRSLHQLARGLASADDAVVARGAEVVAALGALEACDDPLALAASPRIAPAPIALDDARVALSLGELERVDALVAHVESSDDQGAAAVEAGLRAAQVALRRGRDADAVARLESAMAIARRLEVPPLQLELALTLAETLPQLGRRRDASRALAEAEAALPRVVDPALQRAALVVQARFFERDRRPDRVIGALDRALAVATPVTELDEVTTSTIEADRARALRELGRIDEALAAAHRSVALAAQLGLDHPDVALRRRELATTLSRAGDEKAAYLHFEQALAVLAAARGPDDVDVVSMRNALALSLQRLGRTREAVAQLRLAVASDEARPPSKNALSRRSNLGDALIELGAPAEAERVLRSALSATSAYYADTHVETTRVRSRLARALAALGRHREAQAQMAQARVAIATGRYGEPEELARFRRDEAIVLRAARRHREALAADLAAWAIADRELVPSHPERAAIMRALAEDHLALAAGARAVTSAEDAVAASAASPPIAQAEARWVLARALAAGGQVERAVTIATAARASASEPTAAAIDAWLATAITASP